MARKKIDLTGLGFGKLIAVKDSEKRIGCDKRIVWLCRCDCGNLTEVTVHELRSGNTKSCGCLKREKLKRGIGFKHGGKGTRLYRIWKGTKKRCYMESVNGYKRYGGRGIRVCREWLHNFVAFKDWALANGYAVNLTIDRINNNGDYTPDNCQWLTRSENTKKYWQKDRFKK